MIQPLLASAVPPLVSTSSGSPTPSTQIEVLVAPPTRLMSLTKTAQPLLALLFSVQFIVGLVVEAQEAASSPVPVYSIDSLAPKEDTKLPASQISAVTATEERPCPLDPHST